RISPVGVGTARGHERLEAGGRVAEGAAQAVDEGLQLLLLVGLEEGRALERPDPCAGPTRLQGAGQRLAPGGGRRRAPRGPRRRTPWGSRPRREAAWPWRDRRRTAEAARRSRSSAG